MKVCRSGTSVWSRASARTSSSDGPISSRALSAATAIQDLERVGQGQAPPREQHAEVVEDVRGLLAHALVRLLACRAHHLLGLLLDLRAGERAVGQQPRGVAGTRVARGGALGDRPL